MPSKFTAFEEFTNICCFENGILPMARQGKEKGLEEKEYNLYK